MAVFIQEDNAPSPFLHLRPIIRLDELGQTFVVRLVLYASVVSRRAQDASSVYLLVRRSRRISKDSSPRRTMRLVPIVQTDDAS